jgi:hypothetical protein
MTLSLESVRWLVPARAKGGRWQHMGKECMHHRACSDSGQQPLGLSF